jgi:hypothetical protein
MTLNRFFAVGLAEAAILLAGEAGIIGFGSLEKGASGNNSRINQLLQ